MSNNQVVFSGILESGKFAEVAKGPLPAISDDQILIKTVAFAANPTDWKHITGLSSKKGDVLGSDASGIVEQVGKNVKGFEAGDIVSTFLHGNYNNRGAFSQHVVADPVTTIRYDKSQIKNAALPDAVTPSDNINTFEGAASVTLSLATVAVTFATNFKAPYDKSKNAGKTVLIWGGSTVAGVFAIQVAKLVYGLNVIATASKGNQEFLTHLGADHVVDHNDDNAVEEIKKVANGSIVYAYDTYSSIGTFQKTYDATAGSPEVILDSLLFLNDENIETDRSRKVKFTNTIVYLADGKSHNIGGEDIAGDAEFVKNYNHFWQEVVPAIIPKLRTPHLKVLASGLESANEALDLLYYHKVSAQKVVFRA